MSSEQEDQCVSVEEIVALSKCAIGYLRYMFEVKHIRWTDLTPEEQRSMIKMKNEAREVYLLLVEEKQRREKEFRGSVERRKRK